MAPGQRKQDETVKPLDPHGGYFIEDDEKIRVKKLTNIENLPGGIKEMKSQVSTQAVVEKKKVEPKQQKSVSQRVKTQVDAHMNDTQSQTGKETERENKLKEVLNKISHTSSP